MSSPVETLPLPGDPVLARWAAAFNDAGCWAFILDASWRLVFATDDIRVSFGDRGATSVLPIGSNYYSADLWDLFAARLGGPAANLDWRRDAFTRAGRHILAGTPGGREELRRLVDPALADLVDGLEPEPLPEVRSSRAEMDFAGVAVGNATVTIRISDGQGACVGQCMLMLPAAGMSQLAAAAATADLRHLERMRSVESPARRPTAILIADLEASTPLARRLSTAQYFAFGRRLVRAADQCVVDAGGIVGRHAGDGIVAFFLAETAGSESAAARSCIAAAATLRSTLADIADRSDVAVSDVSLRFGLHWGATPYIGRILTAGRSEVTALGDEVNDAARIEACATGGRTLASKPLIERLDDADAHKVGLNLTHMTYVLLAELRTASEKARRDAPALPVCEI